MITNSRRKPFRMHAGGNFVQAIRLHARQDAVIDPAEGKGTVSQLALPANKNIHIGTIPAGSFILPVQADVVTAFAAGALSIGPEDDIDGIATPAQLGAGAAGYKANLIGGALLGYTDRDLEIFARLDAASAVGEIDVLIPFYANAD